MSGRWRERKRSVVVALLGALMAVVVIPRARSTVLAEVFMALGRRPEWARAAAGGSWARLRHATASQPQDIALQVGLATLPPVEPRFSGFSESGTEAPPEDTVTIQRLEALAARFPGDASIRAHLLRRLSVRAVRIERPELAEFGGLPATRARRRLMRPPAPEALRIFSTAASAGARLEPDNAYFVAMRAVAEFAAGQDEAALRDLHSAAERSSWDDHATEEVQAQWKLLDQAYGDRGIVQKQPGIDHLLLPHLMALRSAAALAVWHAARLEQAGDRAAARSVRHDVMQLGMRMAADSPLLVGKSVGLGVFEIGTQPVPPDHPRSWPSREAMEAGQRERRQRYARSLRAQGEGAEADWVQAHWDQWKRISDRIERVQSEWQELAPFPPDRWTGWWSFGILLLAQTGVLLALWAGASLLAAIPESEREVAAPAAIGWAALGMALLVTLSVVVTVGPTFGLSWQTVDLGMTARLLAGFAVLLAGMRYLACGVGYRGGTAAGGSALVWVGAFLTVGVLPAVLWVTTGSTPLLEGSLLTGLAGMGALALAGRTGHRRQGGEAQPRWNPPLVALLAVLPSTVLTFIGRDALALSESLTRRLLAEHSVWVSDPQYGPDRVLPALLILPIALLLLLQLCRVVALRMPLRTGMARGIRRTAPAAVLILLAVYLAALVPTIARDTTAERRLQRMLADPWSGPAGAP